MQLEGATYATATVGGPLAPSPPPCEGQGVIMWQFEDRMVYGLERDGRTVYCSSFAIVSVLLAMGWTLSDSGHWAELARELAAGSPPRRTTLRSSRVEQTYLRHLAEALAVHASRSTRCRIPRRGMHRNATRTISS